MVTDITVEIKNLLKQFELLSNKKQSIFGFENAISALRKTRLPIITLHFSANRFAGKLYTTAQDDCLHVVAGVIVDMSNRPTKVQKPADGDGSSDATQPKHNKQTAIKGMLTGITPKMKLAMAA